MRINPGAVIPPLVVAIIVAYLGVGSLTVSGVNGPLPPLGSPCGSAYPPTTWRSVSSNPIPVLILDPGAHGEICVTYTNIEGNGQSYAVGGAVWTPRPYPAAFTTINSSTISVTSTPATISLDQGARNESVAVVYTVSVAPSAPPGIYGIFLYQFCTLFPFAVGAQGMSAGEFSYWYPHTGSCPAQIMGSQVTGISGFRLVYVTW